MECDPCAKVELANVATPAFSVPVPSVVTPSLNVTVPVAVPLPGETAATVAVNVTDWPDTEGFAEDVSVVVVLAWFTVCDRAADVLVKKFVFPPYTAVMECEPTAKDDVEKVAWPAPFSVPVPMVAAPSLNVTVPVAVPLPGDTAATVAVKVAV